MRRRALRHLAVLALLAGASLPHASSSAPDAADRIESITVEGTVLAVHLASGRVLAGAELAGATLTLTGMRDASPQQVFIESVKVDPADPDREVLLYHLLAVDPTTGAREELCGPNLDGERVGFPLRGQWDEEGYRIAQTGYTLTCSDGAQGKCVRFGYKPWKTLANGTRLEPYHQACVRLITANYCGDRRTTRDGMPIDLYDRIGILSPDPKAVELGMRFEAAWTPDGAACVAHTRVPEHETLEGLARDCPRLAGHLGPEACDESRARGLPAAPLLFNLSH